MEESTDNRTVAERVASLVLENVTEHHSFTYCPVCLSYLPVWGHDNDCELLEYMRAIAKEASDLVSVKESK